MEKIEESLKNLILKNIHFKLDNKIIKKGRLKVFNTKQFFIKFKLDGDQGVKDYELPYPFKIVKVPNGYMFDYCLSAFIPKTEEVYWKMKLLNTDNSSKIHDNYLYIVETTD